MLATASFDLTHPAVFTGMLVLAGLGLLSAVSQLSTIWRNRQRTPPLAEDVRALQEQAELLHTVPGDVAILKTQYTSLEQRLTDTKKAVADTESRLEKDLKRIEEELKEDHLENERRFSTLFQKIDGITATLQNLSNELIRSVGRLEGASRKMEQDAIQAAVNQAAAQQAALHHSHP